MPSISQVCETLLSTNMVELIDQALEIQSAKIIDEYLRRLKRCLETLEESTETVAGSIKTLKRKYDEYSKHADTLDRDIDAQILHAKEELASSTFYSVDTRIELAQEYYEQWQAQEEKYQQMQVIVTHLEQRIVYIRQLSEKMAKDFASCEIPDIIELHRQAEIEQATYSSYLD